MQFLHQIVADFLNKFRLSNPTLFAVILILLAAAVYYLTSQIAPVGSWVPTIVSFISGVLGLLNSKTFNFSSETKR